VSDLPPGWANAKLEQVAEWGSGGTPSRSRSDFYGGTIPWIKTGELGQGLITDTEEKITQDALDNSSAKIFPRGSIAIAMYGATIGKVARLDIDAATNQACAVGIPFPCLTTTKYLLHYLASQKAEFVAKGQGGAQPNISQTIIKTWPIPLAPFKEQDRITEKLDSVLSRVDACREQLDRVPQILKKFREAVLEAAVSGRLTEEWRGGGESRWAHQKLGDLIVELRNGLSPKPELVPPGLPILRISSVRPFNVSEAEIRYLRTDLKTESYELRPKDLLFTRYSGSLEYVGVCGMVHSIASKGLVYPDKLMRVRVKTDLVLPEWIEIVANSPASRVMIERVARTSAGQTGISGGDVKALPAPVPAIDEQQEVCRRVLALFALADSLARRYQHVTARVERLTPSILAKAFRGELVPQDPNDEPAGEMLERIRLATEARRSCSGSASGAQRKQMKRTEQKGRA